METKWYFIDKKGAPTLCDDKKDAEKKAKMTDWLFTTQSPHLVCNLLPVFEGESFEEASVRLSKLIDKRDSEIKKDKDG